MERSRFDSPERIVGTLAAKSLSQEELEMVRQPVLVPHTLTLLDLVSSVADSAETDEEVVATIREMLRSGRVRLAGEFREDDLEAA
jgi:hypothetical protein